MSTHGMYMSKEYKIWQRIKTACYNPKNGTYKTYGARGVRMDKNWKEDFEAFFEDMGAMPIEASTIELIDMNGDFNKKNCRWVNERNRRRDKDMPNQKRKGGKKKYQTPEKVMLIMEKAYVDFLRRQAIEKSREEGKQVSLTTFIKRILEESAPAPKQLNFTTKG